MSLPWAALLKRLSIRLQPHGPSHLIRSQWKPVAPCHHSYSIGPRSNRDSHWSTEPDTLRKPFRCKERILCDSCTTPSHMGGAALGWRGDVVWVERDTHKEQSVISILHESHSEPKASSKILSIKLPAYSFKLYLNENEDHYSTSKLKSLLSLWLCLSLCYPSPYVSLSFISHQPRLVFTCQWLLCKCLSLFFLSPIYMSVAFAAWWCCVEMKVICSVTVRPFYQLLLSSILVSEYWWQWKQGAVKKFCKLSC